MNSPVSVQLNSGLRENIRHLLSTLPSHNTTRLATIPGTIHRATSPLPTYRSNMPRRTKKTDAEEFPLLGGLGLKIVAIDGDGMYILQLLSPSIS